MPLSYASLLYSPPRHSNHFNPLYMNVQINIFNCRNKTIELIYCIFVHIMLIIDSLPLTWNIYDFTVAAESRGERDLGLPLLNRCPSPPTPFVHKSATSALYLKQFLLSRSNITEQGLYCLLLYLYKKRN